MNYYEEIPPFYEFPHQRGEPCDCLECQEWSIIHASQRAMERRPSGTLRAKLTYQEATKPMPVEAEGTEMSTASFQPYLDFKRRMNTQLLGVSDRITLDEFEEWLSEIESPERITYYLIYVQEYVKSKPFKEAVQERFPDKDVGVVPNVPKDEMDKIIEFCETWEPPEVPDPGPQHLYKNEG